MEAKAEFCIYHKRLPNPNKIRKLWPYSADTSILSHFKLTKSGSKVLVLPKTSSFYHTKYVSYSIVTFKVAKIERTLCTCIAVGHVH